MVSHFPCHSSSWLSALFCRCRPLSFIISPAAFSSLVPAKLRIQDGQWFQNGSVWPWEPNGGWYRGEFWHTKAQTRTHTSRNDYSYSGLFYTDGGFIRVADHHLCAHYTHSLDYAAPSVSLYVYTSVCAACNGNPFSSWIADTCRKSRLCKVKSGPFLHEILPCWYIFVWHEACDMCITVCICAHVYTWHGIVCILLWRCQGQHRGAFGGDLRHSAKCVFMWFCFTVGGGEQNKGTRKECVCACLRVHVHVHVCPPQLSRCFPCLPL